MKTYHQLANEAILALKALNDVDRAWNASAKKNGYASHFKDKPQLADWQQMELLTEVVYFDAEAAETLDVVLQEMGIDEDGNPLEDCFGYDVNSRKSREASRAFDEAGL